MHIIVYVREAPADAQTLLIRSRGPRRQRQTPPEVLSPWAYKQGRALDYGRRSAEGLFERMRAWCVSLSSGHRVCMLQSVDKLELEEPKSYIALTL